MSKKDPFATLVFIPFPEGLSLDDYQTYDDLIGYAGMFQVPVEGGIVTSKTYQKELKEIVTRIYKIITKGEPYGQET